MDVVAASLLVLFALVLVVATIARATTAHSRTGKRAHGCSGDSSWGVFSGDGGSDCGGGGGGD